MKIRKLQGDADGWAKVVCLKSVTGWDDDGAPFQVVAGEEYYIQGEADPNIFTVDVKTSVDKKTKGDSKSKPAPEVEEEVE